MSSNASERNSIFLEEARVLRHETFAADQHLLRVRAPQSAERAQPGTFVHVRCDPALPLRRPLSIMRTSPQEGWVELLFKVAGAGTRLLSGKKAGARISLLGPIGRPFTASPQHPRPLLIGGGVGIPPMIFLADSLRCDQRFRPFALFGSEVPFPFAPRPSGHLVSGLPPEVIAAMPLLDDWGVPSRLASLRGFSGCFEGHVTELARTWLDALDAAVRAEVEIFACGPRPMLMAAAALARERGLPCQVSLEEFMACGVGGCAGCVVQTLTAEGPAMKRVCVDGPVFDACEVFGS
jgi:dihydroorotate dehydrogenase electron transfer subunit